MQLTGFAKPTTFRRFIPILILFCLVIGTVGCAHQWAISKDPKIRKAQEELRILYQDLIKGYFASIEIIQDYDPKRQDRAIDAFVKEARNKWIPEILKKEKKLRALYDSEDERAGMATTRDQEIAAITAEKTKLQDERIEIVKRIETSELTIKTVKEYSGPKEILEKAKRTLEVSKRELDLNYERVWELDVKKTGVYRKFDRDEKKVIQKRLCFTGETRVLLPGGELREIRQLKAGDSILALDRQANRLVSKRISKYEKGSSDHYYLVNGVLRMTAAHPVLTGGGVWVEAGDLKVGMSIQGKAGTIPVRSIIRVSTEAMEVYNFDVEDGDNYLVAGGERFYVVHNGK